MANVGDVGSNGPSVPLNRAAPTGPVAPPAGSPPMSTDGLKLSKAAVIPEGPDPKLQMLSAKVMKGGLKFAAGLAVGIAGVGIAVMGLAVVGIPLAIVGVGYGAYAFMKFRQDQAAYHAEREVARKDGRL